MPVFFLPYLWDATYILVIVGALLAMLAAANVSHTYKKYSCIPAERPLTGEMAAREILKAQGISVSIQPVAGHLTDHYDPRNKVLNLSDTVRNNRSIASIGVAAHECGHAIQDDQQYFPLVLRRTIIPVCSIGGTLAWPIILIGVFFGRNLTLIHIGIALYTLVLIFQLVTLPVEFNASRRAMAILAERSILMPHELPGARAVLRAAALTYVAAAAATFLQLLRLILIFGSGSRHRRS